MWNVCGGYHPFSGTLISSGYYLHVLYNTRWYLGECISSIAHEIARLFCFRRRFPHWTSSWLVIGGALTEESKFVVLVQYCYIYINEITPQPDLACQFLLCNWTRRSFPGSRNAVYRLGYPIN